MASAACTVNATTTQNGVNVAGGTNAHIALVDTAGVEKWVLTCIGTDERFVPATVTLALAINPVTKQADITQAADDGLGAAWIFQSVVNDGKDVNGKVVPAYTTTFGIYLVCANGLRISAVNETVENSAAYGWTKKFNDAVRNALPGLGAAVLPTPNTVLMRNGAGGGELEALEITGSIITFDADVQIVYEGGSRLISADAGQNIVIGDGGDTASMVLETSGLLSFLAASHLFCDSSTNPILSLSVLGGAPILAFADGSDYPNPTITQTKLAGNGATAGQPLTIVGQTGQNQNGSNANNNGGPVVVQGGLPGTGGSGAAGVAGSVSIQAGATLVATFTSSALAPSLPITFALGATPSINQALLASGSGASMNIQAQSVTTGTGGNLNLKGGTGSVAQGNASLIGTTIFLEATTLIVTDLAGPSTAITFNLAGLGATSMVIAAGVTGFTLKQNDNANNSVTAATLTIQAPNATGTTSNGGPLALKSGTGTTAAGPVTISAGATVRFTANATGLNIYAATAIAQQTKIANYTDSTGGTPSTTLAAITAGASYAQADMVAAKNAIASLNKEINDLKNQLSQAAGGFAVTT